MKHHSRKKKVILGVVLVSTIALAGLQNVSAGPWRGGPDGWNGPPCNQCDRSGYWGQKELDEESLEARNAFLSETKELRKEHAVKRAEKRALMLSDNPDPKRVSQLTGELFDLREQLQKKAQEKGLKKIGFDRGPRRGCDGPGPKRFRGRL